MAQLMLVPHNTYASEAAHWYTADGEARHTVIAKNGKERNTTLADARKLNLFPSVTSVLKEAASPMLDRWKREQCVWSALTLKRYDNEKDHDLFHRIFEDSEMQARLAAEEGTNIHGALQLSFEGRAFELPYMPHVTAVRELLLNTYGDVPWVAEKAFAHPAGFGGKTDLHHGNLVIDFKGKEFGPGDTLELYDNHPCQLAGYAIGLGLTNPEGAIVFISRNHPGVVQLVHCSAKDMARGARMFRPLLEYWCAKREYWPKWPTRMAA